LVAVPAKEYLQFEAALSLLPALPPDEALACLEQRASKLEIAVAMLDGARAATTQDLPRLFVLETEYVAALHRAELEYVRGLMNDIGSGDLSGLKEWRSWYAPGGERAEPDPPTDKADPTETVTPSPPPR
jgi:hypothetical protein